MEVLRKTLLQIPEFDFDTARRAKERQGTLTKPPGSLGRLEDLGCTLAGITGSVRPVVYPAAIVLAAGSHGICEEGVSAYPAAVTAQMVGNFLHGGAAINAVAATVQANIILVNAGVDAEIPEHPNLRSLHLGNGTSSFLTGPAMPRDHVFRAIEAGIETSNELVQQGFRLIGVGEMGIGNTTVAAAIAASVLGVSPEHVTGRGTMVDDRMYRHKVDVVTRGCSLHSVDAEDPIGIFSAFGGYELAFLCGCILGAAAKQIPVLLDGFPTSTAGLLADCLSSKVRDFCIAGHLSEEQGHSHVLRHLGLEPLLTYGLRLGEGTGAALAMPIVQTAARVLAEMATFTEAAVAKGNS